MTARRMAGSVAASGLAPLAPGLVTAAPAAAHGSMSDPVSRASACFAEGPQNPRPAACRVLVEAGGPQPLYDWNEVNIADAAGKHRKIVPDGELCTRAGTRARAWTCRAPAGPPPGCPRAPTPLQGDRPVQGSCALCLTREGYAPEKPLRWSGPEGKPFAEVRDPKPVDGAYVFQGSVPGRSGRHPTYSVWQRSDSPEAFCTCSGVVFGGGGPDGGGLDTEEPAPERSAPAAPTERQIAVGTQKSAVDHAGPGGDGDLGGRRAAGAGAGLRRAPPPAARRRGPGARLPSPPPGMTTAPPRSPWAGPPASPRAIGRGLRHAPAPRAGPPPRLSPPPGRPARRPRARRRGPYAGS